MSSLNAKDRVSLCLFTFTDGRRCRTPRSGRHPHFCFYHAQKEARAQAAEKLAEDLAYFFSGDYLSACDLSTALSRLIPAVIRGDIKPRLARTVAYMIQTQLQAIHLSQDEYINAFSTDGWREAVRKSVKLNSDYENSPTEQVGEPEQHPPQPATQSKQPAQAPPSNPSQTAQTQTRPQQPATSTPPQPTASSSPTPSRPQKPTATPPQPPSAGRPSPATVEEALSVARALFPRRPDSGSANSF